MTELFTIWYESPDGPESIDCWEYKIIDNMIHPELEGNGFVAIPLERVYVIDK